MKKRSITDLTPAEVRGKRVLVREDLNVPIENGVIGDDTRIRAAVPTIKDLADQGARVVVVSHLGRPKGVTESLRLTAVGQSLAELLGQPVTQASDTIGPDAQAKIAAMQDGDVVLLENVRFHPEEEKNEPGFAKALAGLADLYVNDAFGTAHRAHASTAGVAEHLPAVAGHLLIKEIDVMGQALAEPKRPLVAIIGGSKVSTKIGVLDNLVGKVDALIIGGAMANTFARAQGLETGKSLVEEDQLDVAKRVMDLASEMKATIVLPLDVVVAGSIDAKEAAATVDVTAIPADMIALDIGPKTAGRIGEVLAKAGTVIWNGPVGVFENPAFAKGTESVAHDVAHATKRGAITIVGGGDSVAAVEALNLGEQMSHVSTGGGASLEFLEGKTLPGVAALNDR